MHRDGAQISHTLVTPHTHRHIYTHVHVHVADQLSGERIALSTLAMSQVRQRARAKAGQCDHRLDKMAAHVGTDLRALGASLTSRFEGQLEAAERRCGLAIDECKTTLNRRVDALAADVSAMTTQLATLEAQGRTLQATQRELAESVRASQERMLAALEQQRMQTESTTLAMVEIAKRQAVGEAVMQTTGPESAVRALAAQTSAGLEAMLEVLRLLRTDAGLGAPSHAATALPAATPADEQPHIPLLELCGSLRDDLSLRCADRDNLDEILELACAKLGVHALDGAGANALTLTQRAVACERIVYGRSAHSALSAHKGPGHAGVAREPGLMLTPSSAAGLGAHGQEGRARSACSAVVGSIDDADSD